MGWTDIVKRGSMILSNNSPTILTGLAVAGTAMTAYLAGRASFKLGYEIVNNEANSSQPLTNRERWEFIKDEGLWRLYIPAATTAATTIACIIAANRIDARRAAAMAVAYALSERAFEEYQDKIVEKIGERKEKSYRDDIAQDRITNNPPPADLVLLEDGRSVLCCDLFTGRYFFSDMETLRGAQNDINHQVNNDYYASLSDFYELVGLPPTSMSGDFGWNADKLMDLDFSTALTPSGKPCLTFDFKVAPIRGYSRLQ